jgi:hypothetical protein
LFHEEGGDGMDDCLRAALRGPEFEHFDQVIPDDGADGADDFDQKALWFRG